MKYRVEYLINERVDASEELDSFEAAKLCAVNAVELKTADRALIRDAADAVLFRYPRILRGS